MSQLYMSMRRGSGSTITRTVPSRCEVHARGWDHGIRVELSTSNERRVQDRSVIYDLTFTGGSNNDAAQHPPIRITSDELNAGAYLKVVYPHSLPTK